MICYIVVIEADPHIRPGGCNQSQDEPEVIGLNRVLMQKRASAYKSLRRLHFDAQRIETDPDVAKVAGSIETEAFAARLLQRPNLEKLSKLLFF